MEGGLASSLFVCYAFFQGHAGVIAEMEGVS